MLFSNLFSCVVGSFLIHLRHSGSQFCQLVSFLISKYATVCWDPLEGDLYAIEASDIMA